MSKQTHPQPEESIAKYLEGILERRMGKEGLKGAGRIGPEYWADAPWRLEPGEKEIPLTFIARDAEGEHIHKILVYQLTDANPALLSEVEGPGKIREKYWSYSPLLRIPLPPDFIADPGWPSAGKQLRLKVEFIKGRKTLYEQHLLIFVARESLPLRNSPQWYYGDTHYHSNYTNDIKEFGNPLPDTREAARCIGLEWMIVTDHSVDLQDSNPYWEGYPPDSRWSDLGEEVRERADRQFTLLRGEEVSVQGKSGRGNDTLHLLVFGERLENFIPGAFMNSKFLQGVLKVGTGLGINTEHFDYLFGKIHALGEVLTGKNNRREAVGELFGRSVEAQQALAFAAHPTYDAQGPYGTWEDEDLERPIHGMEAWNTRNRLKSRSEANPFGSWEHNKEARAKEDAGIAKWDEMLRRRVEREDPRFVLLAGSDAHGSFNYGVTIGFNFNLQRLDFDPYHAEDNCLGKVRTALFLPQRGQNDVSAPSATEIFSAIRQGCCVVTDGPILNFTAHFNGREAKMGEIMDQLRGDGALEVNIQAHSTAEFGEVEQVKVFYYFKGMNSTEMAAVNFRNGNRHIVAENLPPGPGYLRLETETHNDQEPFRCATNPIWIRFSEAGNRSLRVKCGE